MWMNFKKPVQQTRGVTAPKKSPETDLGKKIEGEKRRYVQKMVGTRGFEPPTP